MARMMVYNHFDPLVGESKFGDHFVNEDCTFEEAVEHTIRYMRTQYPRRATYFDSDAVLKKVWDVSDFAKSQGRFYGASKIDDVIRKSIGSLGTQGKEYHCLPFEALNLIVNQFLAKQGQPLVVAQLSTKQYEVADEVIDLFNQGSRIILAELCARFGKTIWSGAVAVEQDVDLVIVASYVKTVFTSFAGDLTSFQQFSNYAHVDTSDAEYQAKINDALANGKKVFAYLSLCNGDLRQERINFLFGAECSKMLIVDEADFGAHTENQALPLVEKVNETENVNVIIMTGTNADRAVTHWKVDSIVSVTYPELLMQKKSTKEEMGL